MNYYFYYFSYSHVPFAHGRLLPMDADKMDADVSLVGELLYTRRTVDVIPKSVSSSTSEVSASAKAHAVDCAFDAIGFTTNAPVVTFRSVVSPRPICSILISILLVHFLHHSPCKKRGEE
jgi:hypothetical protein